MPPIRYTAVRHFCSATRTRIVHVSAYLWGANSDEDANSVDAVINTIAGPNTGGIELSVWQHDLISQCDPAGDRGTMTKNLVDAGSVRLPRGLNPDEPKERAAVCLATGWETKPTYLCLFRSWIQRL